jgi:hypothetical protein
MEQIEEAGCFIGDRGTAEQEYLEKLGQYQKELYERNKQIYDDGMKKWSSYNETSLKMDERFDKDLFTVAAGSFGLSFAFIGNIIELTSAVWRQALAASWACFAGCLILLVIGHLLSAEVYRRHRDNVARNMALEYEGKPAEDFHVVDVVSPCNYGALILYIGGIACLLCFVVINL